jgi:acyl-CoA synthetase (NDP forming)
VNPAYETLYGERVYSTLSDLPHRPDCAVLALPNRHLESVMLEVASLGIPAAVIFASAHSGKNGGLEERLATIARENGIAVCGPNCMGFLSFEQKLTISGYPVTPGTPAGSVTLISHSGSVFDSLWQNDRQIAFNYVVSSGNEMVTTMADYMLFALENSSTRVIALFLETVRDPQRFQQALAEAARRDVPVVALKVGRSEQGARLAQAHSGALAGQDAAYDALFARYGVRRVLSLDEMMDTLELMATGARPRRRTMAALLDSGGERAMLADLAQAQGVPFAPLSDATRQRLAQVLEPGLEPANPLDAWGTGNAYDEIYRDCLRALDANEETGLNVFAVDLMRASNIPPTYVDVVRTLRGSLQNPLLFLTNVTSAVGRDQAAALREMGVPVLMGTETGLRAIDHLFQYCRFQEQRDARREERRSDQLDPLSADAVASWRRRLREAGGALDEATSLQLLQAYGIPVASSRIVDSSQQAVAVAGELGYPVVLKTATGHGHKSELDGVRLNLSDEAAVQAAYASLSQRLGARMLVQRMAPSGIELFAGLIQDPQFGTFLSLGIGGIFVEILRDTRLLMLPLAATELREALLGLHGAPLLLGARGAAAVDLDAVVAALMRLAALAADLGDAISELDINPLIAHAKGVVAVDALVIPRAGPEIDPGAENEESKRKEEALVDG